MIRTGRVLVLFLIVLGVQMTGWGSGTTDATQFCASTSTNKFLGNGLTTSGLIGVYSEIEFINRSVCAQPERFVGSWALSWVSIDGPSASCGLCGVNIFQGGYAKCGIEGDWPYNSGNSYVWVYYARVSGACGIPFNTGFTKIYNVSSGTHDFQISKVGTHYNYYVDSALEYQRSVADIETCWPGVRTAEWQNEMLNDGDQGGGPLSNHQAFSSNEFLTVTGWHNANRTLSSACDANSYPTAWHCLTSSVTSNTFNAWDDRFP